MKYPLIALICLFLSFQGLAQSNMAGGSTGVKKYLQINCKKKGHHFQVHVPVDQGFAVGGLSPNAFESRFSNTSLPPVLEFMDQNGYKMTQIINRRGWGLLFNPGTQTVLIFERK